jgi:hypothetical protein
MIHLEVEPGAAGDPALARYVMNPELAVIETYALDVIGELSPEEREEAEDAVVELYGEAPDWRRAVRHHHRWSPLVDVTIADGWRQFRESTRAAGVDAEPAEFARRFADHIVRLSRT